MTNENEIKTTHWGRVAVGSLLLLVGVALLLDQRLELFGYGLSQLWPLVLIGIGIATLSGADSSRKQRHGILLVLIGGWLLVASLELWGLNFSNSWPLAILAVGVATLLRPDRDSRLGGYWLIGTGLIFLCLELNLLGLTWDTAWPLFVILAGGAIIWRSLQGGKKLDKKGDNHE